MRTGKDHFVGSNEDDGITGNFTFRLGDGGINDVGNLYELILSGMRSPCNDYRNNYR